MSIFDNVVSNIDSGKDGINVGLPMGFDRLVTYLPNIQRKTYYLIGSRTKIGKTTLVDDCFLYNPYDYVCNSGEDIDFDVDYYSFEIDKETKILRGITRKLYRDYGIHVDTNYILSRGKNRVSAEIYAKVIELRKYFEKMEDYVTIQDMPENPTGVYQYLKAKAAKYGKETWREEKYTDAYGVEHTRTLLDSFKPHHPNKYHIVIMDHVSLIKTESKLTTKQSIDRMSSYLVELRNNYGIIPVVVQQLAFNDPNVMSDKLGRKTPEPTLDDFSDSRYLSRDANVILGLYSPFQDKREGYKGYNINKFGNYFRNLEIIANRDGEPGVNIGLFYVGKAGTFYEMPIPTDTANLLVKEQEVIRLNET